MANGNLKVEPIQREDKGTYTCTIKQSRGTESTSEKSQSIIVRVIGRVRNKHRCLDVLNNQYKVKESLVYSHKFLSVNNFECSKKFYNKQ